MEKKQVPAAVIVTEPFISSGKAMAIAHGLPDYSFAVIPHPIAATTVDTLENWAEDAVKEVAELLSAQKTVHRS
ncbi:hypothetical protein SAMN05216352_106141 [Alteribacillus bidgolensis]|uniref:UGSC-like domain-containing protein n=3 Tax=Alteribacillus bidgolensis TaxID=930129 RepID=A0A1G8JBW9_9BACI|nr:hypothetical protein SAMN05216352_106141 [Alteribacillus bidgolensis]